MIINLSIPPMPDQTDRTFSDFNACSDRHNWQGSGCCDIMPGGDNEPGGHSPFRITGPDGTDPGGNSTK